MRYLTERKEPKNIGKSAIKTKLEYATNIPSGVAAALPVTFLAVSFTAADKFATVSFTTDSAMFTLSMFFCSRKRPAVPEFLAGLACLISFPMIETHVAFSADSFTCFVWCHNVGSFDRKWVALLHFFLEWHILILAFLTLELPVCCFL